MYLLLPAFLDQVIWLARSASQRRSCFDPTGSYLSCEARSAASLAGRFSLPLTGTLLTSNFLACTGAGLRIANLSTPFARVALMSSGLTPLGSLSVREKEP